jgi:(heptosyl)LPS beta-1,4-glucosyltransferase
MKFTISAILIVKNEEKMLDSALRTLEWCDEIIVIDNNSIDKTKKIAEKYTDKIFSTGEKSFAKLRMLAASKASCDYIFYLDADERVTPQLKEEICAVLDEKPKISLRIRRRNMFYGKYFRYGNWQNDFVLRIFYKKNLLSWYGEIHETPLIEGCVVDLKRQLIHFTHKNSKENNFKSASWTSIEASLLVKKTKKVNCFTILRKGIMEFNRRYFFARGYKDGMEGFIESLVQAINKFLIYIQIWEFQQNPSLSERYQQEDERIMKLWKDKK